MAARVEVGIDILLLERFRRIAQHPRYRRLVFTEAELGQAPAAGGERLETYLAGRFAAKEAVSKVLGTGFLQGVVWRDIEVTRDRLGAPTVRLHRGAQTAAAGRRLAEISVSISHQGPFVVSVAAGAAA
jgi:holo-[acyl-carrier protein] synthase